jgi:hypothetical protein
MDKNSNNVFQLAAARPRERGSSPVGSAPAYRDNIPPIRPTTVERRFERDRIFADAARPHPATTPPPSWLEIAVCSAAVVALWLFLMALDGGLL